MSGPKFLRIISRASASVSLATRASGGTGRHRGVSSLKSALESEMAVSSPIKRRSDDALRRPSRFTAMSWRMLTRGCYASVAGRAYIRETQPVNITDLKVPRDVERVVEKLITAVHLPFGRRGCAGGASRPGRATPRVDA